MFPNTKALGLVLVMFLSVVVAGCAQHGGTVASSSRGQAMLEDHMPWRAAIYSGNYDDADGTVHN
jgi:hypothetical protein